MDFRFARREDTALILAFIKALAEYEKMSDEVVTDVENLEHWLFDKKKAEVIFVLEGEKEVGFALFFHNFSTFLGRAGIYLEDLFVFPEYRGKGYGKALLTELAYIAVQRGCGRLEWWCLDWNKPSIDFYKSMGAIPMDEWTTYRITGDTLTNLAKSETCKDPIGSSENELQRLRNIVSTLRSEGGCPWDRKQTHETLKPACIEEAAEVIGGINLLTETGNPENLKEELGDLLLQVFMHAQIAEEEGLFTLDDVAAAISEKMIRRHPHVFGGDIVHTGSPEDWEKIKAKEKEEKQKLGINEVKENLPKAFQEAHELITRAEQRKGFR